MKGSASGVIARWGVAASIVFAVTAVRAPGDVTTELSSSILIFPKVQSDSTGIQTGAPVDTIIQISSTSNSMVFAHCFYVNAVPEDPSQPAGVLNPAQCQEIDFDIWLTKQQPTHWVVSSGRRFDQTDKSCTKDVRDCFGAGFDPGLIPPVSDPFAGELECIEVDSSGAPINGNHFKGEATLVTPAGDASKYNAIGVLGINSDQGSNNGDNTLCLGGAQSSQCPTGAEYNACPETVILNHFAENANDPAVDELGNGPSKVVTELTLVPCSEDFENQIAGQVTVQFQITNEFEELFSTSTTVACWSNLQLDAIARVFDVGFLGTRFAQTLMTAATDGEPGFVGVAEEFHSQGPVAAPLVSRAALNLHGEGVRPNSDVIVLPEAP